MVCMYVLVAYVCNNIRRKDMCDFTAGEDRRRQGGEIFLVSLVTCNHLQNRCFYQPHSVHLNFTKISKK
jgi:hypothetical protein